MTSLEASIKDAEKALGRYGAKIDRLAEAAGRHEASKAKTDAMVAAYEAKWGRKFPAAR